MIEIKSISGAVLKAVDADSLREANLWGADLRGANLGRANLWGANLGEADLREANLWGADLWEANLWGADLWGADLRGANLQEANLGEANLGRANLWGANLGEADLREANLGEANLRGANLGGAKIGLVKWPSPPMVLLASWGEVSDDICLDLMRYDAANHPEPEKFLEWAEGGGCPYDGVHVERSANFQEKRGLIKDDFLSLPVKSAYELMQLLIGEKCK
jgi:hypothetical protein